MKPITTVVLAATFTTGATMPATADPRPLTLNLPETWAAAYASTAGGLTIACIGDSLVTREQTWAYYVRDALQNLQGNGGGYVGAGGGFGWKPSWTCDQPVPMGQDRTIESGSSDSAPTSGNRPLPWGACSPSGNYFLQQPARVRWEFAPALQTRARAVCSKLPFPNAVREPEPTNVLTLDAGVYVCTWYDTDTVTTDGYMLIHGWDLGDDPGDEVVWHRLGRGGAGAASFLQTATDPAREITESVMRAIRIPDVTFIMIDPASEDTPETFEPDLRAYLQWLTTAVWPDTRIILITHHAFIPSIEQEADLYLQIADEFGYGYINLYDRWTFSELEDGGMLEDTVHLSCLGGQIVGQSILDDLLDAAGVGGCGPDVDGSGDVNFDDLNVVLLNWGLNDLGDADGDGDSDFDDLNAILLAWEDDC
ncbi:MAG: SGNH/GDSL hydrolase family protein [Phycisphaerales bacterium]|nr:SGNH/GDSL hydrolase family protein [Phycisphaerales bacterium]